MSGEPGVDAPAGLPIGLGGGTPLAEDVALAVARRLEEIF